MNEAKDNRVASSEAAVAASRRRKSEKGGESVLKIVETEREQTKIRVIGVGGAGCNALNTMISSNIEGVEYVAINTDAQALNSSAAMEKIQIGKGVTHGLGAGGNPEVGKDATTSDAEAISEMLDDAEIVFLTSGFGGGTGTGATPAIAKIAKEKGILTMAVVTKPFVFEGSIKARIAEEGLRQLRSVIDTVMVIPNQRLFEVAGEDSSMINAFRITDDVLCKVVQAISRLVLKPGVINLDFAHIQTVMSIPGSATIGFGEGHGSEKAIAAMREAISNPLMEQTEIKGAKGVLISLLCGTDLMLRELDEAVAIIKQISAPDANVIFGANVDPEMSDGAAITIIATGLQNHKPAEQVEAEPVEQEDQKVIDFAEKEEDELEPAVLPAADEAFYKKLATPAIWRKKGKRV
ncbi:cell division protein FtsZ [bacterium]|nr:cell division protein FtsZ [bacterium]